MDLITPGIGLVFWTFLIFLLLLLLLRKFAWKPILASIHERNKSIENALKSATKARQEMEEIHFKNEKLIVEAKTERTNLIKEAQETKEIIIKEAKKQTTEETTKLIESAKATIENEKAAAINEIKTQIASLSVEIAEKILKHKLEDDKKQKNLLSNLLDELKIN